MNKTIRHAMLAVGVVATALSGAGQAAVFPEDKPITLEIGRAHV